MESLRVVRRSGPARPGRFVLEVVASSVVFLLGQYLMHLYYTPLRAELRALEAWYERLDGSPAVHSVTIEMPNHQTLACVLQVVEGIRLRGSKTTARLCCPQEGGQSCPTPPLL
jgi:hypothetical protein